MKIKKGYSELTLVKDGEAFMELLPDRVSVRTRNGVTFITFTGKSYGFDISDIQYVPNAQPPVAAAETT